jgi:hypothetical protein
MYPRFDFTFSYWIFAWFILYIFHLIPYNPKLWLILSLFVNIFTFIYVKLRYNISPIFNTSLFLYFIINFFIKVIPIWLLYSTKTKLKDFLFGFVIFILFFLYMWIQLKSISKIKQYFNIIWHNKIHNKIYTPLIYFLHKNVQ